VTASCDVLVLHALGDTGGGLPWRQAFEGSWGDGAVRAPDLPGHGAAPAPAGGGYDLADGAFTALEALAGAGDPPVVVGVGTSGWSASLLALGGRASALVLVDGLGGPWVDPRRRAETGRRWLRALADDPAAVDPAPPGAPDPRARHGVVDHGSRRLVERAAAAMPVPVLLVEGPRSGVPRHEAGALAPRFAAGAALVEVDDASPATVARTVVAWPPARPPG
jgi:hypothetical protein